MNDAERPAQDPSFRLIGSEKIWDRGAALPSRLQSFEAQMLAEDGNLSGLTRRMFESMLRRILALPLPAG